MRACRAICDTTKSVNGFPLLRVRSGTTMPESNIIPNDVCDQLSLSPIHFVRNDEDILQIVQLVLMHESLKKLLQHLNSTVPCLGQPTAQDLQ